jgi:hypothetical protein
MKDEKRRAAYLAAYRLKNRAKSRAYQRAYYLKHRKRIIARTKVAHAKWAAEHREHLQQYNREYGKRRKPRVRNIPIDKARGKKYHADNRKKRNAVSRAYHAANKESIAARHKKWAQANPAICTERVRRRDARKLHATPAWANKQAILAIYAEAARLTHETGIPHAVDHIYPLQHPLMCGLHCEANLQILTRSQNSAKHNKIPSNP